MGSTWKARIGGQLQNLSLMPAEQLHIWQRAEVCSELIDIHWEIEAYTTVPVDKYASQLVFEG